MKSLQLKMYNLKCDHLRYHYSCEFHDNFSLSINITRQCPEEANHDWGIFTQSTLKRSHSCPEKNKKSRSDPITRTFYHFGKVQALGPSSYSFPIRRF